MIRADKKNNNKDNSLSSIAVPILPDYLASLEPPTFEGYRIEEGAMPSSAPAQAHQMAQRNEEPTQFYMTKHPIPGKSMVNFTTLHLLTSTTATTLLPSDHLGGTNATAATKVDSHNMASSNFNSNNNSVGLSRENGSIGLLLAMKALVQLVFNPIVGNLSSKCGYRLPIVVGTCFLLISSLGKFAERNQLELVASAILMTCYVYLSVFAVGESYWMLLLARAIQGVGSACIGVCGMSLVAQHYPEEARRSKVMGIVLGSIALGVLIGYPFGSILYDMVGKSAPFIILSTVIFLSLGMQLLTMDLSVQPEVLAFEQSTKWRALLECKMILAIVIAIWLSTSTMAILEPCLPIWLIQYLHPNKWQLGTVFIPDSVGYFVGTNFFGSVAFRYGQLKVSCLSLLLVGLASILVSGL